MIQWNSIPSIYNTGTAYQSMPTFTSINAPIFQYMPFGQLTVGSNLNFTVPTPQGASSLTNPFGWFNFSFPSFSNWTFPQISIPTFNLSGLWNNFKSGMSNIYNSAKRTVSYAAEKIGNFASRIISGAKKYLGFNESNGSYKKFTNGRTEAWCADFATYVARESGANIPHFSGVSQILDWGRKNGKFSTQAKPGDLIIFKGVNSRGKRVSHTGIVERVENGRVYTVEGNTSDKVAQRSYSLSDSRITGYVSVA